MIKPVKNHKKLQSVTFSLFNNMILNAYKNELGT